MDAKIENQSLFQLLALSLGNAALLSLGYLDDSPEEASGNRSLEAAKQNIELLEMLEEKTKGNLNHEEMQLLQGLLFDLRLKYVDARKRA
jgi:hypothetical protein